MGSVYEDGAYIEKNPTWHVEDSEWKCKQIVRIMDASQVKPLTVVEVGCGAGEILNQLRLRLSENVTLHGYEISPQAFELCRPRERANLHFHLEDFITADTETFDLVLAIDVIEHIPDYIGFLRALRGKGRYKILHVPIEITVPAVLLEYFATSRRQFGHLHYFTRRSALADLEDSGYHVIDWFYTANSLRFSSPFLRDKLLWLPRKVLFSISKDWAQRLLGGFHLMVLAE